MTIGGCLRLIKDTILIWLLVHIYDEILGLERVITGHIIFYFGRYFTFVHACYDACVSFCVSSDSLPNKVFFGKIAIRKCIERISVGLVISRGRGKIE